MPQRMNRRSFVATTAAGVAAGGVSGGSVTRPSSAGSPLKDYAPRGSRRIIYVSDPSSVAMNYLPDPAPEESIRAWVDQLSEARVDVFIQEAYTQGWTTYWREDGLEYDARPQHRRFLPLLERGVQPLEVLLDQCHRRGMEFLAGIRINDNHGHISVEQGVGAGSSFLVDHPEWQIRELPPGPYYKLSTPLDFTFPQVRNYVVDVMGRLVDRFPVDGLELCFRDHRYFPPGKGPERKHLMTDLVARTRAILDERGRLRRKKLLLGARVFQTLDECRSLGLDVETWISRGLIDFVAPNDTMHTEPNVQYEEFRRLTDNGNCLLYPGMLPWTSQRMRRRLGNRHMSLDQQRAAAANLYAAGGDGISFYNHFVTLTWAPFYPQRLREMAAVRQPELVMTGDRHYVFEPSWGGSLGFGKDRASTGAVKADRLLLQRKPGSTGAFRFRVCEHLGQSRGATLLFRAYGADEDDRMEIRINGNRIDDGSIRARSNESRTDLRGVVDPSSTKSSGLPPVPELPGDWRTFWFDLTEPPAVFGDNHLEVTLTEVSSSSGEDILIDELEVFVKA